MADTRDPHIKFLAEYIFNRIPPKLKKDHRFDQWLDQTQLYFYDLASTFRHRIEKEIEQEKQNG